MQWGVRACDKVVVISEHSRRITAESGVPRGQVGNHLLRSGATGVVTRRTGNGQNAL